MLNLVKMSGYSFRLPGILLILVCFFYSCTREEKLTKAEAMEFATALEKSIAKGDPVFLNNAFSESGFLKHFKGYDFSEEESFSQKLSKTLRLGTQLTSTLSDKDLFTFVKQYEKDGKQHVIFRMYINANGSLNYHDYELVKDEGKCKINDVYFYLTGESLSESIISLYNTVVEPNMTTKKTMNDSAILDSMNLAKRLFEKGKLAEAKRMYDGLPGYFRNSKQGLIFNMQITAGLDTAIYKDAIDKYITKFPDEQNINLIMIDGYFLQGKYDKSLESIDKLDSQLTKDPFLDYHRYLIYSKIGNMKEAENSLRRLTKSMPDFESGFSELFALSLYNGDRKAADSIKSIYKTKYKFDQGQLENIEALYK